MELFEERKREVGAGGELAFGRVEEEGDGRWADEEKRRAGR